MKQLSMNLLKKSHGWDFFNRSKLEARSDQRASRVAPRSYASLHSACTPSGRARGLLKRVFQQTPILALSCLCLTACPPGPYSTTSYNPGNYGYGYDRGYGYNDPYDRNYKHDYKEEKRRRERERERYEHEIQDARRQAEIERQRNAQLEAEKRAREEADYKQREAAANNKRWREQREAAERKKRDEERRREKKK